jgi:two-component system chemotaxis response regulator CheB
MRRRDLVAVGTSAGGVEALANLFAQVPGDTPASFLVVQHLPASSPRHLARIIQRATAVPVKWAEHGEIVHENQIYVGPPDVHFQLEGDTVHLVQGAKENHARPAINRLFRSAAVHHGAQTNGVLMTALLYDGVLGLTAIQRCGGVTIVQDPNDAAYPDMPLAALDAMTPDHVVGISSMGALLGTLIGAPVDELPPPADVVIHAALDRVTPASPKDLDQLGPRTELVCPDCGGPMWDVGYGRVRGYRCYLGHASGARSLLAGQVSEIERSLWIAVRSLQERSATLADLARASRRDGSEEVAADLDRQARDAAAHAERARQFLLEMQPSLSAPRAGPPEPPTPPPPGTPGSARARSA